jgi:ABC-type antimicrobial peptide transport system permease subunit
MADSLGTPRARTSLVSLLAALALALALVGTYAVTSFTVGQRVREIGVRMALGADARRVRALVLGRALAQAAAGIALGTAGALALARLLEGQLYGVAATDPPTLAAAAALLAVTALAAGYLPAVRASRVDPSVALREE